MAYNDMLYGNNPLRLPRLPIPKLEDTVSRYLQVRILGVVRLLAVLVVCSASPCLSNLGVVAQHVRVHRLCGTFWHRCGSEELQQP